MAQGAQNPRYPAPYGTTLGRTVNRYFSACIHMGRSRGGGGGNPPHPEKSQKYRVSLQYYIYQDPLKITTTEPAFNGGPLSAHQQNTISMAFRWRADDGPLSVAF